MSHKSLMEMTEIVVKIYHSEFRGKKKGRFLLTREQIKRISGRSSLQQAIIDGLYEELKLQGYCMVDIDGIQYGVISQSLLEGYRKPTKAVLTKILSDYE